MSKVTDALHAILDHFHVHPEDPIRDVVNKIDPPKEDENPTPKEGE
jgi:hypothetical protein